MLIPKMRSKMDYFAKGARFIDLLDIQICKNLR